MVMGIERYAETCPTCGATTATEVWAIVKRDGDKMEVLATGDYRELVAMYQEMLADASH